MKSLRTPSHRFVLIFSVLICTCSALAAGPYQADWKSLDARPTPEWFLDAKFGIFIHWGIYSVPAWGKRDAYSEWYWQRTFNADGSLKDDEWGRFHRSNYGPEFQYHAFAPLFTCEMFDPAEWADVFRRSGAKYVVLTSKHHDGFCLWPSKDANKTWGRLWNSVDTGPNRDLLGDLTAAVRDKGLKMGFYYSLYEWFNPLWRIDRKRFVDEHMLPQFKDVVTRYKPSIIFSDGEWDMTDAEWRATEFLAWLFNESPCKDDVVINDRWGKGIRHKHGGYYTTEYGAGLQTGDHPWEECRGIGHSFGYNRNEPIDNYKTTRELVLMLVDLVSRGGNLLLNIGPTSDGRIPVIMQSRLSEIGEWLNVNGEAIYGSRTWSENCQWTEGKRPTQEFGQHMVAYNVLNNVGKQADGKAVIEAFFTFKSDTLYAILPSWPGRQLILKNIALKPNAGVTMLGVNAAIPYRIDGANVIIDLSNITPDLMPCSHAWTLKMPVHREVPKAEPAVEAPQEQKPQPTVEETIEKVLFDRLGELFKKK